MTVRYLGHCSFLFEDDSGGRLLIDPFGDPEDGRWFLKPFPPLAVDLVAVTHDHFDHNAVSALAAPVMTLESATRIGDNQDNHASVGSTTVTGIRDLHSGASGKAGMENIIFVIEHGGVRYCHMGDNRHDIPDAARARIGKIDVLMIPVDDSCHLLTYREVDHVIDTLAPRVVIPMHYFSEGLTAHESTLLGVSSWLRTKARRRQLRQSAFRIDRRGLPYEREAWRIPAELA